MFRSLASRLVCGATGTALSLSAGSFPRSVRIECTNACNSNCVTCPRQRMKRPVAVMPDDVYARIIAECGRNRCREVQLHHFGEPLLDANLEEKIRLAKAAGVAKVKMFSNGSLLTEDRSRGLLKAGLDEIAVSFDGKPPRNTNGSGRPSNSTPPSPTSGT
ncbi:MAG: radical SAM protein [Planctomycetaceae bacterium]|nr:radical SAM protein [Planctomycetaceae bacterium]